MTLSHSYITFICIIVNSVCCLLFHDSGSRVFHQLYCIMFLFYIKKDVTKLMHIANFVLLQGGKKGWGEECFSGYKRGKEESTEKT